MKFLSMITTHNPDKAGPPPPALFQAIGELAMQSGAALKDSGGMATTCTLTVKGGDLKVDGPYAEAKEVIGGYGVYELDSEAEAVEWTRKFIELHRTHWPAWEGEVILRQMIQFPG